MSERCCTSFYKGNCDLCCVNYYSIPDENFEDHSAPPSPEEKDSGFFMLRKDSERRATLHRILTEDQDKVVRNLMESLAQVKPLTDTSRPRLTDITSKNCERGVVLMTTQQTDPRWEKKANPYVETAFLNTSYF